jgi:hypothetical protein
MAKRIPTYRTLEGEELAKCLPCPFCGEFNIDKQNYLHITDDKQGWLAVGCSGCGCQPSFCVRTEEEAIKHWNSRVTFSEEIEFQAGIEYYKRYLIDLMS